MKKLKQFLGYALAGMFGALIVLGANFMIQDQQANSSSGDSAYNAVKVKSVDENSNSANWGATAPSSFSVAAKKATPAVVKIKTQQQGSQSSQQDNPFYYFFGGEGAMRPRSGAGSGVIVSADGYIVTNNHVIEGANEIKVILDDTRTFYAKIIGVDKRTDLAVLKIEASGLPTLSYANSDDTKIGDWVLAIGNPFEYLTSTVTAGIVSAKGRDINILSEDMDNIEAFIQTDAAVNPGNSGGALVNTDGNLVGINTAIATQTGSYSGYSFAIPVNLMKRIVEDIIEYGDFKRAMLGVGIQTLEPDLASEIGVKLNSGVFVNRVTPGGAAELGGVLPKDVIATVNGRKVTTVPQIQELIGGKKVGETVNLEIIRKGKRKELSVRLKEG